MKRIKAINGFTIYEATARDEKKGDFVAGEFYIYLSSDIRDYGLSNSYYDWNASTLAEAIEWTSDDETRFFAQAYNELSDENTAVTFAEIEERAEEMRLAEMLGIETDSAEERAEEIERKTYGGNYAKTVGGNIKLGNMATFSKLYGNDNIRVDKLGFSVKGSCGGYCAGCKKDCYVRKSYRYGSVIYRHALNTLAFRNDLAGAFLQLDKQLTRKRKKFEIFRINQSGELETTEEFLGWCELAKNHPETEFYIYSKAYDLIIEAVEARYMPANMTLLVSIWHEYGIEAFKRLERFDNVKAFVYLDRFDYGALGIECTTTCKAYNELGKLDHNITCDKCRKCFNRFKGHKIIGCLAH